MSCWRRRRAGSASTRSSTVFVASSVAGRGDDERFRPSRAHPGSPPRIRSHGHPDEPVHPRAPRARIRQAHPPGRAREPLSEGRHADDGRAADRRRRHRHLFLPSLRAGRVHVRPAGGSRRRRRARCLRRLPQRPNRRRHPRSAEADLADGRRVRRSVADPADLSDRPDRGAVRRPRLDRPTHLRRVRRACHRRRCERGEHHGRPRRPLRRDAGDRLRRIHADRAAQRADRAAEPCAPVCADHRRAAGVPLVQRPPGADLHRGFGGAVPGGHARGDRADHGPDPRPAVDRDHLRHRDDVGDPPGGVLQDDGRPATVPDEPDPPPLRARRLGRGEDHHPFLDRGDPRGPARRDPLPRLDPPPVVMTMTTPDVLDLDTLTLAAVRAGALRDRPVTVLGLARSGIALTRFFVDAGAAVTVYDGRRSDELGEAIAALGGRAVRLMLGPDVDPSAAWAGASLVATSPSISPDFPTTEPALRSALRALVDARGAGDATVPALVSEADLFLRLCPAPTVGVTGTKGKTTTSSLTAAILAAHPSHPVILGGNIGSPLIERVSELTPAHRVVDELSELQLPTLSRGTTVAVYTNVTADHLDRHGTLEAYRAVKRRLMELVPDGGAVVLNAEDAVVSTYEPRAGVTTVTYRRGAPVAGGMGVVDGWIVADGVPALDAGGRASSGQIMPVAELAIPGAHNISNALAGIATGLLFGVEPEAIRSAARHSPASSTAWSTSPPSTAS